jgi:hypothetical protein
MSANCCPVTAQIEYKGNSQSAERLGTIRPERSGSVQTAGGPRLKGSPSENLCRMVASNTATISGMAAAVCTFGCAGGKPSAKEQQSSQCMDAAKGDSSEPGPPCAPVKAAALPAPHTPPNWPVRTSSASIDTGANKAEKTANGPPHAASRAQSGRAVAVFVT